MKESQERQLVMLKRIYETCIPPRPVFKPYHDAVPDGMVPYISCSDLFDYKFNHQVEITDSILQEEASNLMKNFFQILRQNKK